MVTTRSSPKPKKKKASPKIPVKRPKASPAAEAAKTPQRSTRRAPKATTTTTTKKFSPPSSESKSKRPKNFTEDEDAFICRAFVNVSENPILGNDQKSTTFWSAVQRKYSELAEEEFGEDFVARDADAILNRFRRHIQKDMFTFNTHYKTCKSNKQSGKVDEDYIKDALDLYLEFEGKAFRFPKCVEILHQMPKFNPMVSSEDPFDTDSEEEAGVGQVNDIRKPMGGSLQRPIGTKAAKKQLIEEKKMVVKKEAKLDVVNRMASASERLAIAIEKKNQNDNTLKMATLYASLGEHEKAKELLNELDNRRRREEDDTANDELDKMLAGTVDVRPIPTSNAITALAVDSDDDEDDGVAEAI